MELAGLEPATSWVRFTAKAIATVRHASPSAPARPVLGTAPSPPVVIFRRGYLTKLDQHAKAQSRKPRALVRFRPGACTRVALG
jgi:hypothetical protein